MGILLTLVFAIRTHPQDYCNHFVFSALTLSFYFLNSVLIFKDILA